MWLWGENFFVPKNLSPNVFDYFCCCECKIYLKNILGSKALTNFLWNFFHYSHKFIGVFFHFGPASKVSLIEMTSLVPRFYYALMTFFWVSFVELISLMKHQLIGCSSLTKVTSDFFLALFFHSFFFPIFPPMLMEGYKRC